VASDLHTFPKQAVSRMYTSWTGATHPRLRHSRSLKENKCASSVGYRRSSVIFHFFQSLQKAVLESLAEYPLMKASVMRRLRLLSLILRRNFAPGTSLFDRYIPSAYFAPRRSPDYTALSGLMSSPSSSLDFPRTWRLRSSAAEVIPSTKIPSMGQSPAPDLSRAGSATICAIRPMNEKKTGLLLGDSGASRIYRHVGCEEAT